MLIPVIVHYELSFRMALPVGASGAWGAGGLPSERCGTLVSNQCRHPEILSTSDFSEQGLPSCSFELLAPVKAGLRLHVLTETSSPPPEPRLKESGSPPSRCAAGHLGFSFAPQVGPLSTPFYVGSWVK